MGRQIRASIDGKSPQCYEANGRFVAYGCVGHQASGTRRRAPGVGHQETYIKVKGVWTYLYRAVDKFGKTIDFMLSEKRDKPAATRFFAKAIGNAGLPEKVVMDKSGANLAGINAINEQLTEQGFLAMLITVLQVKYLNNIIEQDHRFIKKITRPMLGFKSIASAEATLAGIELHHIIRKGQLELNESTYLEQFYALAG